MPKHTLSEEEKKAIREVLREKYPGEIIVLDDETDEDGNPRIGRIKMTTTVMPPGWSPRNK